MSKFTFEFATLSPEMEKTLKDAVLPVRRAIIRSIAEAVDAPINSAQAKRLGISRYLSIVHSGELLTDEQRQCSEGTTERWINDVIELSKRHGGIPSKA